MDFTRYYVLSWTIAGFDEDVRRFNSTMLVLSEGQAWKSFWQLILYVVIKACHDFMKLPQQRLRDLISDLLAYEQDQQKK